LTVAKFVCPKIKVTPPARPLGGHAEDDHGKEATPPSLILEGSQEHHPAMFLHGDGMLSVGRTGSNVDVVAAKPEPAKHAANAQHRQEAEEKAVSHCGGNAGVGLLQLSFVILDAYDAV
jgi:hypothetical protein